MTKHKYRIAHIIGARPHFMKLAPVYHAAKVDGTFEQTIVHTGQHYDESLSGAFLKEFDLPNPDYNLEVGSQSHLGQIGHILLKLDAILTDVRPDIIYVYGDTNSTVAGAIAASKRNIPLAHVEAGLREFDKLIPEEVNKLLIDSVADLLFCPTQTAVDNLALEQPAGDIYLVGDVVVDLLKNESDKASEDCLKAYDIKPGKYYFATSHRVSNTDNQDNLREILLAFGSMDMPVLFSMHPRTKAAISQYQFESILEGDNVQMINPVGFWESQCLIKNAYLTITDSGGVIKESYFHKTPCLIIDKQTEWVESVEEGWAIVVGPNKDSIIDKAKKYQVPHSNAQVFGDGSASTKILMHTKAFLNERLES